MLDVSRASALAAYLSSQEEWKKNMPRAPMHARIRTESSRSLRKNENGEIHRQLQMSKPVSYSQRLGVKKRRKQQSKCLPQFVVPQGRTGIITTGFPSPIEVLKAILAYK